LLEDVIVDLDLLGPLIDKVGVGHRRELTDTIVLYANIDAFLELVKNISECLEDIDLLLVAVDFRKGKVVGLEDVEMIIDDVVLLWPFLDVFDKG
jgi:hypothetical protein